MTFVTKITPEEMYAFIVRFYTEYKVTPGAGFMAGVFKVTPQTIHTKLNELELRGKIKQIKKVKNIVSYELL